MKELNLFIAGVMLGFAMKELARGQWRDASWSFAVSFLNGCVWWVLP